MNTPHHVVIIGGGFGGLFAAKALKDPAIRVTLIDRNTHHLFQPLLYQVATGILSEGEISPAIREVLRRQRNVTVLQGLVESIDLDAREVHWRLSDDDHVTSYDSLIVASGVQGSYFGHPEFATFAPEMKTLDDALELRARIFGSFEAAEVTDDPAERERLLTFVVVGAGPTGVEVAGQLQELAQHTLKDEYRRIDTRTARVILVDAVGSVLNTFGTRLSAAAARELRRLGVELMLDTMVTGIDAGGVEVRHGDGSTERIPSACKVWAAGVTGSPLGALIAAPEHVERSGKVQVTPQLELPDHEGVFVIGDLMSVPDVPGMAQGAIQSARYAAKLIRARLAAASADARPQDQKALATAERPFSYVDKGSMATIAKFKAVASVGSIRLTGFIAWIAWLGLHLLYIAGFKQQVGTLVHWFISFLSPGRAERSSTRQMLLGRLALERLGDRASAHLLAGESPEKTSDS